MKKVLSISLGSSKRDHLVQTKILGEDFLIERRGTDGDKRKAYRLFTELDGQYDAFGIGGIDLYIYTINNRYTFRDARKLIKDVRYTPAVDGSGLKNTLERMVIEYLEDKLGMDFRQKKVLLVAAVDRFGMAESFVNCNADIICGDLIFGLGIPVGIKSLKSLHRVASIVAPIITRAPIEWVYPTGNKQENSIKIKEKYAKYYRDADIIAGDFLFIKRYLPDSLEDKIIVTNTVTEENIKELEQRGVRMLITTTPELNGRSFGTNVMEAVLVALSGVKDRELKQEEYIELLRKINFTPRVIDFTKARNNYEYV
ncbi:MAG TPA: quinate 5-dehydrogenase [Halanaerobiaceae bacterium]|nr:quinate 5-dehydrogenase [Halanaerobiaceae bacterium]